MRKHLESLERELRNLLQGRDSATADLESLLVLGRSSWIGQVVALVESDYRVQNPLAEFELFRHGTAVYLMDAGPSSDSAARTILAVGRPQAPDDARETSYQVGYPLPDKLAGRDVDRGHFVAYTAGGLYGPNLFVQDRALNRGWSEEGRRFRKLEQMAASRAPHTLAITIPYYADETDVPSHLTMVVLDRFDIHIDHFRNRYDDPSALTVAEHLAGATDAQIGALGEEVVGLMVGEVLDGTVIAMGDAGMERNERRQDLDLLVALNGDLTAVEVKTRYLSRQSGRVTRAGNLPRPRMRRPTAPGGPRQLSQLYAIARLQDHLTPADVAGIDCQVWVVDLRLQVAQVFGVQDDGRLLPPESLPLDCQQFVQRAVERILKHRGHL